MSFRFSYIRNFARVFLIHGNGSKSVRSRNRIAWPFFTELTLGVFSCFASLLILKKQAVFNSVHALKMKEERVDSRSLKLTGRERRFVKFASIEHGGQLFMTTQDFIDSITEADPKPRLKRRVLQKSDLEKIYAVTPRASRGTSSMFRDLHDKAIISYTEYLFLLSVLTKPASGFQIAFNMFDTDGNQKVSRSEFLVLEQIFSHVRKERRSVGVGDQTDGGRQLAPPPDDDILQRRDTVTTTLLVHFFGTDGNHELCYGEFKKFMENLQAEILEIEFQEFARGYPTISEVEFARILLRYTDLQTDQYGVYIDRLMERLEHVPLTGVTFAEFQHFCSFLNHLDDFAIAMCMYTMADQPISQEEFNRAVLICTGRRLSRHVVNTVFCIFDDDGDGHLSYKEFIGFMKERKHRGFQLSHRHSSVNTFKDCVQRELQNI